MTPDKARVVLPLLLLLLLAVAAAREVVSSGDGGGAVEKPLRVLALSNPMSGHANPVLAIARGLLQRGHRVTFCTVGSNYRVPLPLLQHENFTFAHVPLSEEQEANMSSSNVRGFERFKHIHRALLLMHRSLAVGLLTGAANVSVARGDFDIVLSSAISAAAFDVADALAPREGERLPIAIQTLLIGKMFDHSLRLPYYGRIFTSLIAFRTGYGHLLDRFIGFLVYHLSCFGMPRLLAYHSREVREEIARTTDYRIDVEQGGAWGNAQPPLVLASRPRPLDLLWEDDPAHVQRVGVLTPSAEGLGEDLARWFDESTEVLYVALGTVAAPTKDEVQLMARAFDRFLRASTQAEEEEESSSGAASGAAAVGGRRVLWSLRTKFHELLNRSLLSAAASGDAMRVEAWVPQRDVLEHPKVRAFFTHGGYNSVSEAALFGKPMIGVPFFGDQPHNIQTVVKLGLGVGLELYELNDPERGEQALFDALMQVWNDSRYLERAKSMAAIIGPPEIAVERSVQLLEYLVAVGGRMDLFMTQVNTTFYDIVLHLFFLAVLVSLLTLIVYAMYRLVKAMYRLVKLLGCCIWRRRHSFYSGSRLKQE